MNALTEEAFSDQNFPMQTAWTMESPELGVPLRRTYHTNNSTWDREIRQDSVADAEDNCGYHVVHKETIKYELKENDVTKRQQRDQTVGVMVDGSQAKIRWLTEVVEAFKHPDGSPAAVTHPEGKTILREKWENEIVIDIGPLLERGRNPVVRGFTFPRQDPTTSAPPPQPMRAPRPPQHLPPYQPSHQETRVKEEVVYEENPLFFPEPPQRRQARQSHRRQASGTSWANGIDLTQDDDDARPRRQDQEAVIQQLLQQVDDANRRLAQFTGPPGVHPMGPPPPPPPYAAPPGPATRSQGKRAAPPRSRHGSSGGNGWSE